jgi:hypothetical protein
LSPLRRTAGKTQVYNSPMGYPNSPMRYANPDANTAPPYRGAFLFETRRSNYSRLCDVVTRV